MLPNRHILVNKKRNVCRIINTDLSNNTFKTFAINDLCLIFGGMFFVHKQSASQSLAILNARCEKGIVLNSLEPQEHS